MNCFCCFVEKHSSITVQLSRLCDGETPLCTDCSHSQQRELQHFRHSHRRAVQTGAGHSAKQYLGHGSGSPLQDHGPAEEHGHERVRRN